jgi:soluble lytic murein transglycosylase-like protein
MPMRRFKKNPIIFSLTFFVSICFASKAGSDIYRFIDANGVLHFTNVPSSNKYRLYLRERTSVSTRPPSADRYDHIIVEAAENHDLPFSLLKAIIKVESDFNPTAVSKKGAKGLMQLMPERIENLKIKNPFDPVENVMGGAQYFRELLDRFKGELQLSLAAYNAGPSQVLRYNRIPPFKETEDYIRKVMSYYRAYKKG